MERARTGKIKWMTVLSRLYEIRKVSKDNNLLPSDPELIALFASDALIEIRAGASKEEKAARARPYPSPTLSTTATIPNQQNFFNGVDILVEFAHTQSWIPAFGDDWMSALFPLSQPHLFVWLDSIVSGESSIVNCPSALSVYLGDVEELQRCSHPANLLFDLDSTKQKIRDTLSSIDRPGQLFPAVFSFVKLEILSEPQPTREPVKLDPPRFFLDLDDKVCN